MIFGAESIPEDIVSILKESKTCCLSLSHEKQLEACQIASTVKEDNESCGSSYSFSELALIPVSLNLNRPPGVEGSKVRLHCSLFDFVDLAEEDERKGLFILEVNTFEIGREVLRSIPSDTNDMNNRLVSARIEANLLNPIASLGEGKFGKLSELYHMYRPKAIMKENESTWENGCLTPQSLPEIDQLHNESVHFTYLENSDCKLGYNPTMQIVQPRPIGWISTYKANERIEHVAPYSFFIDVGRGNRPMIAFVSMMRNKTERKDAQKDSEENGVFACNVVPKSLAEEMNYSSAGELV